MSITETQVKEDLRAFFDILEQKEENSEGRVFSPTFITSVRVMHATALDEILPRLKEYATQ